MKRPSALCTALLWALYLALAASLCAIVHWRYAIFRNDVDLGIFTQVIAGLGHGFSSTAEGGVNHLLVHWSPTIVLAWPFLRAFGPVGLEYFQAIVVATVLFPVWGLARARFGPVGALAVAAVAALYPILWANGVGDFHEMAFVPPLSALLVYALDRRRWAMSLAAALLLACTKEDQFFVLAANGLLFAIMARGDARARRAGWTICGAAIAMSVLYFAVVRPLLNPNVPYAALQFFDWTGPGAQGHDLLGALIARARYVALILVPLGCLPCISRYGLFLVPGFVEILGTNQPVTLAAGAHYSALLTGYALAAFVGGAAALNLKNSWFAKGIVAASAAVSISIQIFASPMEYWYYLYRTPNAHDALLAQTLESLPPRADVGAEDEIFAHLGLNPNASVNFHNQRWFVFDRTHYSVRWHEIDEPAVRRALALHEYAVISDRDQVVVIRRTTER